MAKMQSLFFIAVTLAMLNLALSVTCPYPYIAVGSGCYTVTLETGVTWEHAFGNCKLNYNGYLAEIESAEEQADIIKFLLEIDPSYNNLFWIGLSDEQVEGEFRWMTSGHYLAYSSWMPNQPDYTTQYNCVYADYFASRAWNDCPCSANGNERRGLCETDPI